MTMTMNTLKINQYGNVDARKGLPKNYIHVPGKRLGPIARKVGAKVWAPALCGWEETRWGVKALIDGIVCTRKMAKKVRAEVVRLDATRTIRRAKAERARAARQEKDIAALEETICELYPGAPKGEAGIIAEGAARIGSGRVGRCRTLDPYEQARRATVAHVRHRYTNYEQLLRDAYGHGKRERCREEVAPEINAVLSEWFQAA